MNAIETCSLCPRLCRFTCPVATVTGREAAVPAQIAGALLAHQQGRLSLEAAVEAASSCVDCGACAGFCHVHSPLPDALRVFRLAHGVVAPPQPLRPIDGDAPTVAVLSDTRDWSQALADRIQRPVARWWTSDRFGTACRGTEPFAAHADRLRAAAAHRELVVADGGVARALTAAGVPHRWLHEVVGDRGRAIGCCGAAGPLACCGGGGPLAERLPAAADELARAWLAAGGPTDPVDARCAAHLRRVEPRVRDAVDRLLRPTEAP